MNKIFNEDCLLTMNREELQSNVDLIITSPPYNTSRVGASDKYSSRYDKYQDKMSDSQYCDWTVDIFNNYDKVLKKDGCVLYNLSYSSENPQLIWLVIADIIKRTNFTTADTIIWKKSNAIPNNVSKNKLTRIIEYVFVFCRKSEFKTFNANKKITGRIERTGQANYENIYNFIEAKNNDGSNPLNKATFSTELVKKLLNIYALPNSLVYDNFIGIGTTAKACLELGHGYVGSEISQSQIEHFLEWEEKWKKDN
jgi:site-specific DNA-methyltransferase (adenine-specific)